MRCHLECSEVELKMYFLKLKMKTLRELKRLFASIRKVILIRNLLKEFKNRLSNATYYYNILILHVKNLLCSNYITCQESIVFQNHMQPTGIEVGLQFLNSCKLQSNLYKKLYLHKVCVDSNTIGLPSYCCNLHVIENPL